MEIFTRACAAMIWAQNKTVPAKTQRRKEEIQIVLLRLGFAGSLVTNKKMIGLLTTLVSTIPRLPLTLTQQTVTGMLIRLLQNHSSELKRWLGVLLVVFIFYGTTVEAAHRHGRILPSAKSGHAGRVRPFIPKGCCSTLKW